MFGLKGVSMDRIIRRKYSLNGFKIYGIGYQSKRFQDFTRIETWLFFFGVGWGIFNCNPCINKTSVSNPPKSPEFMVISG